MRDRTKRFQSAEELETALNRVREGWIPVQCHVTAGKHLAHGFARWIDRNAHIYTCLLFATGLAILTSMGFAVWRMARAFL